MRRAERPYRAQSGRRRLVGKGPCVRRFTTLDPALAIATTDSGDQVDLLVVPPQTSEAVARRAMAADPTSTMRAPDVLAAATAASAPTRNGAAGSTSVWDNEGGHLADAPRRPRALASPDQPAPARR